MSFDLADLPDAVHAFLAERHLGTLTTLRPDGSPHVTPVGFMWDPDTARVHVITSVSSTKVRHLRADPRVVLCQVDRGRWLSLEGVGRVSTDPAEVQEAVDRYGARYQAPRPNPTRVSLVVEVTRMLGRATPPSA